MTERSVLVRLMKILGALVGAFIAFGVIALAKAQSHYDADQSWIRQTLREERKAERRAYRERHALTIEYRDRHVERRHRHRDRWRESPVRRHYYAAPAHRHYDRHDGTRVYGIIQRGSQFVERHATSHVECFPAIQEQSGDFSNDAKALNEAEVRWAAKVAVQYGMLFADFRNAADKKSTCFRSTFDESWWGRNREAAAQNLGISEGFKKRCLIEAKPCRAPVEILEKSRTEVRMGTDERR